MSSNVGSVPDPKIKLKLKNTLVVNYVCFFVCLHHNSIMLLLFTVTFAQAFYHSALNESADAEFVVVTLLYNLHRLRSITLQQSHQLSTVIVS